MDIFYLIYIGVCVSLYSRLGNKTVLSCLILGNFGSGEDPGNCCP
jgi:hypothetical protein